MYMYMDHYEVSEHQDIRTSEHSGHQGHSGHQDIRTSEHQNIRDISGNHYYKTSRSKTQFKWLVAG